MAIIVMMECHYHYCMSSAEDNGAQHPLAHLMLATKKPLGRIRLESAADKSCQLGPR